METLCPLNHKRDSFLLCCSIMTGLSGDMLTSIIYIVLQIRYIRKFVIVSSCKIISYTLLDPYWHLIEFKSKLVKLYFYLSCLL